MKQYAFIVEWNNGTINEKIIEHLKQNHIEWHYNHFMRLVANLHKNGKYYKFEYEHIEKNKYGILAMETEEF